MGRVATADSAEAAAALQVEQARLLIPLDQLELQDTLSRATRPDAPGPVPLRSLLFVPGVPESNHVFLLSPAGLQPLTHNRVAGGILVMFDGDYYALLLMTEDPRAIASFRQGAGAWDRPRHGCNAIWHWRKVNRSLPPDAVWNHSAGLALMPRPGKTSPRPAR